MRAFPRVAALLLAMLPFSYAAAGTTGTLTGRVVDRTDGRPIALAAVTVSSPSQSERVTTDATGTFVFASLAPDTYALTVTRTGYEPATRAGISIHADQTQTVAVELAPALRVIANVRTRVPGLVRPGITSDVFTVDAQQVRASTPLAGAGSYDQTYAAMAAAPGVMVPQGQAGWYQRVYIRGGDQDQSGYEYDGIPVERRDWQSSPLINFSTLGVQDLELYTGGLLATSDATGIAGYVNEVVKRGGSPGYVTFDAGIGAPSFYHSLQFEAGGAADNVSYYVGMLGANASYRYVDGSNGAGLQPGFFFPIQLQNENAGCNPVPSGYVAVPVPVKPVAGSMCFDTGQQAWNGHAGFVSAPGAAYGIATTWDRENVANVHVLIPHKRHDGLKDDVQVLLMESEIYNTFLSSLNDLGGPWPNVNDGKGFVWQDGMLYTGPVFRPPDGSTAIYAYPGSPPHPYLGPLPAAKGDYWSNGAAIVKLQYQWNFDPRSFLRLFAYTTYSDWLLNAPASLNVAYGLEAADWEPNTHTLGIVANYANQLGERHYLTVSSNYERTLTHGWSSIGLFGEPATPVSNLVGTNGYCYDPLNGAQDSCYDAAARGTIATGGYYLVDGRPLDMSAACASGGNLHGTPACLAGAQMTVTETGANHLTWDATPAFTSAAFNDRWRPSDGTTFDLGLRVANFAYSFPNVLAGFPARQFWFDAYNNEHCFATGQQNIQLIAPILVAPGTAGKPPACAAAIPQNALGQPLYSAVIASAPTDLTPNGPGSLSSTVFEPRTGFTQTIGRDDVVRASWGVAARPPTTAWMQFGGQMQDLASFLGDGFLKYGFNSPVHPLQPDRSYNLDATWEHAFKGTGLAFRITPYLRKTADQQQVFAYNALLGLTAGLNVGQQTSAGVEFLLDDGDFAREGVSWRLSYTHNHSSIRYANFADGVNVIDQINYYIRQYDQYTQWCNPAIHKTLDPAICGVLYTGVNARPIEQNGVINPYYGAAAPALPLDRNASYPTYDVFPAPFYGDNGYDTPDFATLVVSYRHRKLTVAPSVVFESGSYYGNPLTWPGYDPASCLPSAGKGSAALATSCTRAMFIPRSGTQFDTIGEFRQPAQWSGGLQIGYDVSPRVRATATLMHVFDACLQRGYSWDRSYVCEYSQLPGNVLPGIGNVASLKTPVAAPPQLRYPYAAWNSNYNTDYQGVVTPFQVNFSLQVRL